MSVTVQEASFKAKQYLREVLQITEEDLVLEEIERAEGLPLAWRLTFSYPKVGALSAYGRTFKTVKVLQATGEVDSVKIRVLE